MKICVWQKGIFSPVREVYGVEWFEFVDDEDGDFCLVLHKKTGTEKVSIGCRNTFSAYEE